MLRVNAINRQKLLKCLTFNPKSLVFKTVSVPIIYKGVILNNSLKLDLIVEDRIIIELKSVDQVKSVFFKQLKTYLRLLGKPLGLLVNFGENDMKKGILRVTL